MSTTNENLKLESGINVISISEITIDLKTNQHGFLKVVTLVDENDTSAEKMDSEDVKLINKHTNEILFCGIISSIEINFRSGNKVVTLECETGSSIFDREEKTRTFQNEKLSDIISKLCKEYGTQVYIDLKDEKDQFSVQYRETDFEFMRRLASEKNMILMPHIKDSLAKVYFGVKNSNKVIEVTTPNFVRVDQMESKTENSKFYHVFNLYDTLEIGDTIKYEGKELVVMEVYGAMKNSILSYTYKACLVGFINVKRLENERIIGATLKAEVIEAQYQSLKVKYHVDNDQDISKAKWINYSPIASNAWYSLAHIGNEVDVYFPSSDVRGAIAVSTTRVGDDGENTMKNPKDKVFATKWGSKLSLSRRNIELSNSFTEIKLGDNIDIRSNDSLTVEALNEINIGKTTINTIDSDGNKKVVVKETRNINIEADEMVSFVVKNKSGAIEVDDEVAFTSCKETVAEGILKCPSKDINVGNDEWIPRVLASKEEEEEEEEEEEKGGFWSKVGKCLLVGAVAVAAVAIAIIKPPSVLVAALGPVASRISAALGITTLESVFDRGAVVTSVAPASIIYSKLSLIKTNVSKSEISLFDLVMGSFIQKKIFSSLESTIKRSYDAYILTIKDPNPVKDDVVILALENFYSICEKEKNYSRMDATIRAIQKIEKKNNMKLTEYNFESNEITAEVSITEKNTFTLEEIHSLHINDDTTSFALGLVPIGGLYLSPLYSYTVEDEQTGEFSLATTTKNASLSVLGVHSSFAGLTASSCDLSINTHSTKPNTYIRDKVSIQAGDTYISIRLASRQGLDISDFKVYLRNDKVISYKEFRGTSGSNSGYDVIVTNKWKNKGYK